MTIFSFFFIISPPLTYKALKPVLDDFFQKHPLINPDVFLGDSAFDTINNYQYLLKELHFNRVYIPLNRRSDIKNNTYTINEDGIPCCPNDPNLPMKSEGKDSSRKGFTRYKFICPKVTWKKGADGKHRRSCSCEKPCTDSPSSRMIYIYPEKDLRAYPGTLRGTDEWNDTYKIRSVVEKSINHFKDSYCLAGRRTQNEKALHADLLLSGIAQLLTVVLADKINQHKYIRSIKPLIA
ncbi:MAG: hypothetical protein CVU95_13080 [Firmicutes bacterium HGW-Firmicutes-2]|nr:MAG: hypothetical protein CVU95_13080 [Firmicutes bacterium HGW-Firmicutes-2]